ncbi:hypothetical protein BW21_1928 [Burkholderia humptydooensis]|uniref:Uncharacterized protein n=1 Tax=Burkholderia humptydooensis MSMB43 TaxID=441157 RepID=A0ABN0G754_9BURK|nr:hypothetical protein BW21_1928 [Burkholderia sp. 2002721687]EIP87906.1 hypothetical protein A33K_15927 [Burkholderia humptydooensis MSMB43]
MKLSIFIAAACAAFALTTAARAQTSQTYRFGEGQSGLSGQSSDMHAAPRRRRTFASTARIMRGIRAPCVRHGRTRITDDVSGRAQARLTAPATHRLPQPRR